ncbi:hypothetical protein GQ55_4G170600 [Panicum hallii var. hallii]|uniref:Uncharacterized protein n=1 Tax=Panicum hallii var. hallii TaxID=1504633 RepID=A0A2T7DYR4_9POAL|nr:hypothetical protein GQ55_4G170600 [Panicum hallii var. hallii]
MKRPSSCTGHHAHRPGPKHTSPGAHRSGDAAPRVALAIVPPANLRGAGHDGPGGARSAVAGQPRRRQRPVDTAPRAVPAIEPPADLRGVGHDGPGGAGSAATGV